MPQEMRLFESRAFLLLLAGASCLFGWLLLPFFDVILWAVVIGVLFSPLNRNLSLRFGLDMGLPMSAAEVGKILGMTADEVTVREAEALKKLRNQE